MKTAVLKRDAQAWIRKIKAHQTAVGKVRDALRKDIDELAGLEESCDRAYNDLQCAIDALSEWA